jgi:diguanylate cyclase (GGDEF)-like protein
MSVLDDLTVQREEAGLIRSTLEHVVLALGASGGVTFLMGADRVLTPACSFLADAPDPAALRALAQEALGAAGPLVREKGKGWLAAAPLVTQGRRLGVLSLHEQGDREPPPRHFLEAIGKQIGTGLDNVRLYAELRSSAARMEALHRITATLTSKTDVHGAVRALAREIAVFEDLDRLACGIVDESGEHLEVTGHPRGASWGCGPLVPVLGSGLGSVVLDSRAVLRTNLGLERRFPEDERLAEEGIRSYVLLPLTARGRSIGVLALGSGRVDGYDSGIIERVHPIADAAALALDNLRLLQRTHEMSITDEVTPLYNLRFCHQILDRELKLVDRYRSLLSLIFLDLDRFKPINDRYGHARGSRVLREVGLLLRGAVRETDYPARYGGDEFVVILPQTDGPAARVLGEKLRRLIEAQSFLKEEGIHARVGLSLGVATYPTEAASKDELIRLADERMYADKARRSSE